jgi:hypothetical protein
VLTDSSSSRSSTRFITELADEIRQSVDATVEITAESANSSLSEKNLGNVDLNTLLITLATSGGVLTTLINLIKDRVTKDRTITIEIDGKKLTLTGIDIKSEYTNKLVEEFIRSTTASSPKPKIQRDRHGKSK